MFENQLIVRKKAVMGRSKPPLLLGEDEQDRKEERRERKVLIVQLDD